MTRAAHLIFSSLYCNTSASGEYLSNWVSRHPSRLGHNQYRSVSARLAVQSKRFFSSIFCFCFCFQVDEPGSRTYTPTQNRICVCIRHTIWFAPLAGAVRIDARRLKAGDR